MDKELFIQGSRVFYRLYGSGKPVILVHGFGETGDVWKNQIGFLQDKCLLIVPDLAGSGQSDMIADMSMEGLAEVIHAIIHEENIDKCHLIGHSMGGYITLAFAEKYWNHLEAFGLFHSSAYPDSEEKKAIRRKGISFMEQHGGFEFLKTTTPNLFSPFSRDEKPELIDEFIGSLSNFLTPSLVLYYQAMMARPDRVNLLKNNNLPVLFVIGEFDNAIPFEDMLKLCHLPEKSYIEILHQSGHMGMLEEVEKSNHLLGKFIKET